MAEPTPRLTRRSLLTTGALGVAAGIAASTGLTNLSQVAAAAAPTRPGAEPETLNLDPVGDDVVAHVQNASSGEVALLFGTREFVYRDPALVSRLLAGARRARTEA